MSFPDPPTSLDGSCSVIYDNTLYSYSSTAFLSLSLTAESKWKTLTPGESVSGAACVLADDALFIVGGVDGSDGYSGLQKYSFSTKKWTTLEPTQLITQNRQYHGAAYIKSEDKILVYAGSTDGSTAANADTWTIQASEPYNVESFGPSSHSVTKPILLQWSDSIICLVGGDTSNVGVALFTPNGGAGGWWEAGISLSEGLSKDTTEMQAILVDGTDNSKSLYTFDFTVTPNAVKRFVLQNANGTYVSDSPAITKRDLTLDDWPEYNSTNAPTSKRTDFAIAQSDDMVVISGGNDDDPLVMFDAAENSWLDASDVFAVQAQSLESVSTTTKSSTTKTKSHSSTKTSHSSLITSTLSSTATSTGSGLALSDSSATATSTDAAAVAGSGSSGLSSNAVLGITLGSIVGFLAVLLAVLLLLRRRKKGKQQNADAVAHTRGLSSDEKVPMVFHDPPPPASSPGHLRGHNPQFSQESYSSMAILMGRAGKPKAQGLTRKPSAGSDRSSSSTLHKQLKAKISKPILHEMQHPALENPDPRGVAFDPTAAEPRPRPRQPAPMETEDGMRRSSGWNRYWSGGSALQILGFGGPPKRLTVADDDGSSHYSESTLPNTNPRATQDSATVPPLNFDFKPEFNRVNSGSPVVEKYTGLPFKEGMAGKIERPTSKASSGYSSGIPESVNDQWQSGRAESTWGAERAPSSVYNNNPSFYFGTPLSPSTAGPPRNPPSGVSTQPQLAMASTSSDMSWLNLGDRRV